MNRITSVATTNILSTEPRNSVLALLGANLVYACESVFIKLASGREQFSAAYFLFLGCAVAVLGVYAILWQQIIKRMSVSRAYMFKGTVLVFVLILSALFLGETITWTNVLGAAIIVCGIVGFAKQ